MGFVGNPTGTMCYPSRSFHPRSITHACYLFRFSFISYGLESDWRALLLSISDVLDEFALKDCFEVDAAHLEANSKKGRAVDTAVPTDVVF